MWSILTDDYSTYNRHSDSDTTIISSHNGIYANRRTKGQEKVEIDLKTWSLLIGILGFVTGILWEVEFMLILGVIGVGIYMAANSLSGGSEE